jgi:hypothetical protein
VRGCSDSQPLYYYSKSSERALADGFWIAIGEVYCDCASDRLAMENLQKTLLVEDLLQYSVTDDRTRHDWCLGKLWVDVDVVEHCLSVYL